MVSPSDYTKPLQEVAIGPHSVVPPAIRRGFKLLYWVGTGQLGRAFQALLPYWRRYAPWRLKALVPTRLRAAVARRIAVGGYGLADGYAGWIARNDTLSEADRRSIRAHIASFQDVPKFSILMVICSTAAEHLREAVDSVMRQLYEDWELCVVCGAGTSPQARRLLEDYARKDNRVRLSFQEAGVGIEACTNAALGMASGKWMVLTEPDDVLSEHALYLLAETINRHGDAAVVYSDEDKIDERGHRFAPYFKPDWDYDLFLGRNFIDRLGAYRVDLARQAGGFREGYGEWDFALRVLDAASDVKVHHVPFVLYHRRQAGDLSPGAGARVPDSAPQAVNEHFARSGQDAVATLEESSGYLRVLRSLPAERPVVSVVIPTKDRCGLLRTCLDGLLNRTDYAPLEVVVVDNGSREPDARAFLAEISARENVRVVDDPDPFNFSRLVNRGVAASSGTVCVLLNNDVDVIDPGWLAELVGHALRPEVGAVGAKLYYADGTLQHGGVVLGLGDVAVAGQAHRFSPRASEGYFGRLKLTHNVSCVTAACLALRREVFDTVGGFNEQELKVAYNDVDFCIRLRQAGYKIIWTPHAELYHYESLSRGSDTAPENLSRYRAEVGYMRRRWGPVLDNDPFYNPNLSLKADYQLAETSRVRKPWLAFSEDRRPSRSALDNVGPDPRRVSTVNFVAIQGMPRRGKTSFAIALAKMDGFLGLHSDQIIAWQIAPRLANRQDFIEYPGEPEREHFNVQRYVDGDSYDHRLFIQYLGEELRRKLNKARHVHTMVLEGYIFKHYSTIFADLGLPPERTLALHASTLNGRYLIDGFDVTGQRYDEVLAHIRHAFRRKCLETTLRKSRYQNFESLGLPNHGDKGTDSDTSTKYECCHVDDFVRPSDRVVDIGCNAGYFCFRISEKTTRPVIGVDTARHCLETASHINNSVFFRKNLAFLKADALQFLSEHEASFDLVHCASTYHYFRERQVDFLRAARRALSNRGRLVLEVELADQGAEPETIMASRGVDATPCAFPNRPMFMQQIDGLFRIDAEFPSVFQRGSFYDRVYFHLRPYTVKK